GTKVVVQDGGQYNVFIGNGQTLVLGNVAYQLKAVTSAVDPTRTSVAVVGASGTAIEVKDSSLTGGALGGLLQFRNDTLTVAQNSIGRMAIALSDTFNAQHKLGVDLNGALGQNFFTQSSPSVLSNGMNQGNLLLDATFSNTAQLTTSDYTVEVNAGGNYVLTRLSDKQVLSPAGGYTNANFPLTFDGITLSQVIPVGAAQPGDSFLIQPTNSGARNLDVLVTDVAQVAAAAPIVTGNVSSNKGSGVIGGSSVNAAYLATPLAGAVTLSYATATTTLSGFPALSPVTVTLPNGTATTYAAGAPVPYTSGAAISFDGITVTLSGAPANGDTFTIAPNAGGVSDGRNALLLGALEGQKTIGGSTATFNDAYAQLVSNIGNKTRQVDIANAAQTSLVAQIRFADQSATGVNQDEETANLLIFQQMYQANAKVIQTASTIFDAVLALR
ncbi:MAG: flagellar hook-associated protein FlgK, partial [Polaromonas sp.]|nr:flagellar hook-associated protein FlgK [Polaromonas sp.]